MASGTIDGTGQADDVDFFAGRPRARLHAGPRPAARTRHRRQHRRARREPPGGPTPPLGALATSRSYPARTGHDQFYGYGRVNTAKAVGALVRRLSGPSAKSLIPPEVEITSPAVVRPDRSGADQLRRHRAGLSALGPSACTLHGARRAGPIPEQRRRTTAAGDFKPVSSTGELRRSPRSTARWPRSTSPSSRPVPRRAPRLHRRRSPRATPDVDNGRPNKAPYGFTVKVVASDHSGRSQPDRRGRARHLPAPRPDCCRASRASSRGPPTPATARPRRCWSTSTATTATSWSSAAATGSSTPSGPTARSCRAGRCTAIRCRSTLASGPSTPARSRSDADGAILASIAADDLDHDGVPEVFAADMQGKVYAWRADGHRFFQSSRTPTTPASRCRLRQRPAMASSTERSTGSSARRCSPTSTVTARKR